MYKQHTEYSEQAPLRIWPDYSYVTAENWNEESYKYKGDDFRTIYISDDWGDEEIEDFIELLVKLDNNQLNSLSELI